MRQSWPTLKGASWRFEFVNAANKAKDGQSIAEYKNDKSGRRQE
jgi:hypothetical protein